MAPRGAPFGFDGVAHERHHGWRSFLFRLLICSAVTGLGWWCSGWVALLVSLMLWARVFAPDLLTLASSLLRGLRWVAHRPVEGRLFMFKGQRIRVLEDETAPQRWLAVDDLSRALGQPVAVRGLVHLRDDAPHQARDGVYVLDEVALQWLRQRRDERAGRLAWWLEREVWYPARGRSAGLMQAGPCADAPTAHEKGAEP